MSFIISRSSILLFFVSLALVACSGDEHSGTTTSSSNTFNYNQNNYILVETDTDLVAVNPSPPYQTQTIDMARPNLGTLIPFDAGGSFDGWLEVYPFYVFLQNGHIYMMDLKVGNNLQVSQISNLTLDQSYCYFTMDEGYDLSHTVIRIYQYDTNNVCGDSGFEVNLGMNELAVPTPVSRTGTVANDPSQYAKSFQFLNYDTVHGRGGYSDLFLYSNGNDLIIGSTTNANKKAVLFSNKGQIDFFNAASFNRTAANGVYYGVAFAAVDGALYAIDSKTESAQFIANLQQPFYNENQMLTSFEAVTGRDNITDITNYLIDNGKLFEILNVNNNYSLVAKPAFTLVSNNAFFSYGFMTDFLLIQDAGDLLSWGTKNQQSTNITQLTGFNDTFLYDASYSNLLFYDTSSFIVTTMDFMANNITTYNDTELRYASFAGKRVDYMYLLVSSLGQQTQISVLAADYPQQNTVLGTIDISRDAISYYERVQTTKDDQVFWGYSDTTGGGHLYVTDRGTKAFSELLPDVTYKNFVGKINGSSVY